MEKNKNCILIKKTRDHDDGMNHINISLPNGLLCFHADEYFILNVNSFNTCANWYNGTNKNN